MPPGLYTPRSLCENPPIVCLFFPDLHRTRSQASGFISTVYSTLDRITPPVPASGWPCPHCDPFSRSSFSQGPSSVGYTKLRHPGDASCATHYQKETPPLRLNQTLPPVIVQYHGLFFSHYAPTCTPFYIPSHLQPTPRLAYRTPPGAHMFHRSQNKQQQGFAREQRIADAQLASLRHLGLVGQQSKGFASAWGGTDPTSASSNPSARPSKVSRHFATRPFRGGQSQGPVEKGEPVAITFQLCVCVRACVRVRAPVSCHPSNLVSQAIQSQQELYVPLPDRLPFRPARILNPTNLPDEQIRPPTSA